MKRSRWWIAGALLAVGALVLVWGPWRQTERPTFETVPLDKGPIVSRVSASGTVSARTTVLVGSQVSGRVSEIHVDFNSPVRRGQLIARIDPRIFEAGVEQARANLRAARAQVQRAEAQLGEAEREVERKRVLVERKLIGPVELESARARLVVARADLESAHGSLAQASAAVQQAELNLTFTEIVSPIDGVVISRDVDVGQTVAASLQAPTLFTLAEDLRQMQVHTNVAESDVARIEQGGDAEFTVDAYPGRTFTGTIREIRNAAQTNLNVVTYDAVIDVENPDLALKPGMTASVSFVLASRVDAVRLPNAALRFRPPAGTPVPQAASRDERTIWFEGESAALPVTIRTGITDGTYTEVLEGAQDGDRAIVDMKLSTKGRPRRPGRLF